METGPVSVETSKFKASHLLNYNGVNIVLQSNLDFEGDALSNLQDVFAKMQEGDPGLAEVDGEVTYIPDDEARVVYDGDKAITVYGPVELFGKARALTYIAGYMAECLRSSKLRQVLVHSAAVYNPRSGLSTIIMGEKGAGKTTLAIKLCREYGFELIGNDQVYVGLDDEGGIISGEGSTWLDIRETAIKADSYLGKIAMGLVDPSRPCSWNNKVHIDPSELGIEPRHDAAKVGEIFHVRIDRHQPSLYVARWSGLQRNLILHEKIGRHVTGQATPFQSDEGEYLGSLPPINLEGSLKVRDSVVKSLIGKGITELFGPESSDMAAYISGAQK